MSVTAGAGYPERTDERMTIDRMGKHSALTRSQRWLLAGFAGLGIMLTPLSFAVMFLTVYALLVPYMGGWSWTVPVGTEVGFMGLFLADILLESRQRPSAMLHLAPYAFAVVSLWLNAAAAHGSVIGMVGHSVLPMVFFGYLLAAKLLAKRLAVSGDDRKREVATRDAIAHARDILRAADRWWRFRAPVLLRRQIRARRLPAAVIEAIDQGVTFGGPSKWEPAVEAWITRALTLPEGVQAQLAAARAQAAQVTSAATPEIISAPPVPVTPGLTSSHPAGPVSGQGSGQFEVNVPATPQARPRRAVQATPRRISDTDLKKIVKAEFDRDPSISVNAAAKNLGRSRDRVRPLLEAIRREANVQPLERKAAQR